MTINNVVAGQNLGPEFDLGNVTVDTIRVLLGQIAYDNTASGLTATDAKAAIDELALALSGVAHTAITGIDLTAGANPNEYLVEITWTDENGNAQTTTDPTPITITDTATSASPGNLLTANADGSFFDQTAFDAALDASTDACVVTDVFGATIGTVLMDA